MKTSELTGAALDWAVAKIEFPDPDYEDADRFVYIHGDDEFHFTPSTDWAQGGPIIERESIAILGDGDLYWEAECVWAWARGFDDGFFQKGSTPLIAAMRCYVTLKLGDEVEVPEELKEVMA
jgi:hypothetical protein